MRETDDHFGRAVLLRNEQMLPAQAQAQEGAISPWDRGFTVGLGVFETLLAVKGVLFAFHQHDRRLRRSAERLGLPVPPTDALREAATAVLGENPWPRARVRVTVTGGPADGPVAEVTDPTVLVSAAPVHEPMPSARLVTAPWSRNEEGALVGVKATSYAENLLALHDARQRGADEALLLNTRGEICEGTGSNIFLVLDGVMRTPPLDSGCLAGVTRAWVLECAAEWGMPVDESVCRPELFEAAEEVFLTSTLREVQPVHAIDGMAWQVPGRITEQLRAKMRALLQGANQGAPRLPKEKSPERGVFPIQDFSKV